MARKFSLGLIVALLLVFAITEASRGQTSQVDGPKIHNRGSTKYNSKSIVEPSDTSEPTTRSPRDKSSRSEITSSSSRQLTREDSSRSNVKLSKPTESLPVTSRTNARHLNSSANNLRNRSKSHTTQSPKEETTNTRHEENKEGAPKAEAPKRQAASRRISSDTSTDTIWVDSAKLDHEVFTKWPERSRSRTGRKIYTSYNEKELRSQIAASRTDESSSVEPKIKDAASEYTKIENIVPKANASRTIDMKGANNSNNREDTTKERDVLLSGSESVRVDVPLAVGNDENVNLLTSVTISPISAPPRQISRLPKERIETNDIARSNPKKNRQSDRSKSRSRSKINDVNSEIANTHRGSSRFSGAANAEVNEQSTNSKTRSSNTKSRGRASHRSRDAIATETKGNGRTKNADNNSETNANRQTNKAGRNFANDRRTSEGKRRSKNRKLKSTDAKIDEQDVRTQSRNRLRSTSSIDVTTAYIPKMTIAETTTVSTSGTEITTFNPVLATIKSPTIARTFTSTERIRNKGRDRDEGPRSKKPPKEDFFNHGLGFRGRKTSTESTTASVADLKATTPRSETQLRGNPGWTLRRRPGHINQDIPSTTLAPVSRDQTNEIIALNERTKSAEATPLSNAKPRGRGTKRPLTKDESNNVSDVATKNVTRGNKTFNKSENFGLPKKVELEESDNYPPAFRARLSQLKNLYPKPTGATIRISSQATKSNVASLFSERSKMKLDLARRLIKPQLNVDENDFDVTTIPYSDKSKAKEVTVTERESENVEKTTKATDKLNGAHHVKYENENTQKGKPAARGRWKILEVRKSLKDQSIKIPSRLLATTTKKSRVTSEKTTAPSFEGSPTKNVVEINVIPRRITVSNRGTVATEETAATTIDTTKVRPPIVQITAVSEVGTTVVNTDENGVFTTIEPLKLDKISVETIDSNKQQGETYNIRKGTTVPIDATLITEFPYEITLSPAVTASSGSADSSFTSATEKIYPVYVPDAKKHDTKDKDKTKSSIKSSFWPRYTKQEQPVDVVSVSMVTSKTAGPTSRYVRKKSGVFTPFDSSPKSLSTETSIAQTKRREFRPRTSTYRRHSEPSTSQLIDEPSTAGKGTIAGVTVAPRPTQRNVQIVTPGNQSSPIEPSIDVRIDTSNGTAPRASGVIGNGNGNNDSNVFNPTRSAFVTGDTSTLLEQLRSTVAPLLSNLGNRTPIFSGAYSNVNTGNSGPRITPNGSPPRFSARYKGAELLVRKPSGQAVIPSITTSSTTPTTPIESSGSAPPIAVNSPGEPRFVTFYQALESASIRNENPIADEVSQRQKLIGAVTKDTTTATTTAQGPAGSGIIQIDQTTDITTIPTVTAPSTVPNTPTNPKSFTSASIPTLATTTTETATLTSTMTTTTTTMTTTSKVSSSSRANFTTGSLPKTTTPIDINENLVSTETTTDMSTTTDPNESVDLNIIPREETTTTIRTTSIMTPTTMPTATNASTTRTTSNQTMSRPLFTPNGASNTGPLPGRFGGGQTMPAPRPTDSRKTPIRDYLIYGIYPNKTIVRKRPEDNLIDARNVDSPYVIFGIYPDGRLVRKFPNGTIIPDSTRSPVEVVFTLSTTTTTNRPAPGMYYNQANPAVNNQYQAPMYNNNRRPVDMLTAGVQKPGPVDFGLIGNAINVPPGDGPNNAGQSFGPPASAPNANKMNDVINTQMGTPNAGFIIGNMQMPNGVQGPMGSFIIPDRDRIEASRTRVTSDQSSSVYIGQDKFINYQIDRAPNINPKVVDVKINSVATSLNEGRASSTASIPSFENLLSNQSSGSIITAPPGFPWRDPLDQIFGITTNSPVRTASVASNQLDESAESDTSRPVNPLVEIFTPITRATSAKTTDRTTIASTGSPTSVSSSTAASTATSPTTAATTTAATTTTTTTTMTTTTTTTTTSTTTAPTTTATRKAMANTIGSTTRPRLTTTASSIIARDASADLGKISADNILNGLGQGNVKQNSFGTTFDDLAFLNSLLQNNVNVATPKTLTDVEQMLANRILTLALAKPETIPGPTRSSKAIQSTNTKSNENVIKNLPLYEPSSDPIIIDLLPYSTVSPSNIKSSTPITTTKSPVIITAKPKTTARPKATSPAPVGIGVSLWRALFGGNNFFETSTTASAKQNKKPSKPAIKAAVPKPVQANQKPVAITQKPVQNVNPTTHISHIMSPAKSQTTPRSVDISDIQVLSTGGNLEDIVASASTPSSISTRQISFSDANPTPNVITTSTYSPEDDAKFLAALLKSIQAETRTSTPGTTHTPAITQDDEAFLRAILSNQAIISTPSPTSTETNPSALLALLLKQQGIEPSVPSNLREQLQLAGQSITSQSNPTTARPTILKSSTQSQVSATKNAATQKPSPRARLQTTTWAPSSTYPPPLFGGSDSSGSGFLTATRTIGQFLGAAITGAAQQLQSYLRNGTRSMG